MNNRVIITSKNAELIYSNRICCYDDEQLNVKIRITDNKEDELKLKFLFKYSNSSKSNININADTKTGVTIELINFNNPLGTGLKKPISIAKLDNRSISVLFNVYKNGDANPVMDLSVYLEDPNGK